MENPYSSPSSDLFGSRSTENTGVSDLTLQHLARTKGWVRFFSVLGFIGSAFMLLAGTVMLVTRGAASADGNLPAEFWMMVGVFYLVFAFIYIYPSFKLWKYAARIGNLKASRSVMDLEGALNEQRAFWKFIGVVTLVFFFLMPAMVIFVSLQVRYQMNSAPARLPR